MTRHTHILSLTDRQVPVRVPPAWRWSRGDDVVQCSGIRCVTHGCWGAQFAMRVQNREDQCICTVCFATYPLTPIEPAGVES